MTKKVALMSRRDAIKFFLAGTASGAYMGWSAREWWAERSFRRTMEVSSLEEAFRAYPNAEYVVIDNMAPNGAHHRWFPTNRTSEFELDHIVGGEELSPGVFIQRIVFIKFKEDGDYYRGIADIYGITRAEAKRRTFAYLYGGELRGSVPYPFGTPSHPINNLKEYQALDRIHRERVVPVTYGMDFAEIEKRVLLARNK